MNSNNKQQYRYGNIGVTRSETLNLTSLNLVRNELLATIEQSAAKLEQFVTDRNDADSLQGCIDGIKQISGTLSLIQLRGADLLAQEVLNLANEITLGEDADVDEQLTVLTSSFFILPRYLEYAQQTRRAMPVLLIPHINELRLIRKATIFPESYFFEANLDVERTESGQGSALFREDLAALVRRLRHMYQVGLLNVLQGKQVRSSLGMMQRALERLDIITGGRALGKLWWVGSCAIEAMAQQGMEISKPRKMLLAVIDRQLKLLQKGGISEFDREPGKGLIKELLYLIVLSGHENDKVTAVKQLFETVQLGYTDKELRNEREAMKGPSASTLSSMAAVLKDELRSTKAILERASQGGTASITDYDELIDTLNKVAEILAVVGLVAPSNSLKQEITKVESWRDAGETVDAKELLEVADVMLYIESTVSGLETHNLSDESLARVNIAAREDVIAASQLAEAEMVVLQEAESGLALVKRALNSFSESNYDRGHIKNVAATLNAVRGGMVLLHLNRAGAVVAACTDFIENTLLQNDQPAALQHLLETFADAVISLEYYLDAVKGDKSCDDKVLEVAEESLEALGHRV